MLKKASSQKYWAWNFLLPWWTVDFWETIEKTLCREIKEEVNLTITSLKLIDVRNMIIENEHWLWLYYIANCEDLTELKNLEPWKHEFCGFIDINEINFLHKDVITNYILWNREIIQNLSNIYSDEILHSMENYLYKYIDIKIHHLLKEKKFKYIKIKWVYDRKFSEISKFEKNDKMFNWKRPTAFIEWNTVIINCFPWDDYVKHYYYLINSFLKINNIENVFTSYELPSNELKGSIFNNYDFSELKWSDYVILWHIDKIWIFNELNYKEIEDFKYKIWKINWKKVTLLWVEFSLWWDIWWYLIKNLSKYWVKNIIYIWKLWWINGDLKPNEHIATWNNSVLKWKSIRWKNLFEWISWKNVVHWKHYTHESVILENKEWLRNNSNFDFVDPEIWQFAKFANENWVWFSYIHIVSNNLNNRNYKDNLSNERKKEVIKKRDRLFKQIWNILLIVI
jgi:ADP-ribose pyrophosphatase YjhB (NUDIX family)